jgi:hypothetical protein
MTTAQSAYIRYNIVPKNPYMSIINVYTKLYMCVCASTKHMYNLPSDARLHPHLTPILMFIFTLCLESNNIFYVP